MTEPKNTKSVRKFQFRDYLYDVFVEMSTELNCSVDYLINEAMREYLAHRAAHDATSESAPSADVDSAALPDVEVDTQDGVSGSDLDISIDDTSVGGSPPFSMPPPLPGRSSESSRSRPELFMIFDGERQRIEKDEFIIGRGAKVADFAIRDGNISRRHAAVVFQDGAYYIKDLGSTNGINYGNRRVESKRIEEGDVYRLCDYELRFTYE